MKRFLAGLLLSTVVLSPASWAADTASIELRIKGAGVATEPAGTTYPSVFSPAAPKPDQVVTGSAVTIDDFRDLVISIDGMPSAATTLSLTTADGQTIGSAAPLPMFMIDQLSAEISEGAEHFTVISDSCTGVRLAAPGAAGSTCQITIQPRASWFGPLKGTLLLSSGDYKFEVPLSGRGAQFDPLRLTLQVKSGNPGTMHVNGPSAGPGTMGYSTPVTFTASNTSTEFPTTPMAISFSSGNFEVVPGRDACSGTVLGPGQTCEVAVRAKAWQDGAMSATMTASSPTHPVYGTVSASQQLAGTATGFETFRWQASAWGGCSASCSPSGGTQTQEYQCIGSVRGVVSHSDCRNAGLGDPPYVSRQCNRDGIDCFTEREWFVSLRTHGGVVRQNERFWGTNNSVMSKESPYTWTNIGYISRNQWVVHAGQRRAVVCIRPEEPVMCDYWWSDRHYACNNQYRISSSCTQADYDAFCTGAARPTNYDPLCQADPAAAQKSAPFYASRPFTCVRWDGGSC
ncbi:hypothetical protein [Azospirillum sp. SYSU D00513]|uniref:hypothetical protein n=1 Tax=Azospirillum sp. SYSU D00513 TaxID=2812561 RepID=UPI001A96F17E|nr:hypothetical protein [Azospirillum sp. SYSU D00513]